MFWVHMPEEDYWRLIIGSPMVADQGAAATYSTLDRVLKRLDLAGITLEDISLLDPSSRQFQSLRTLAGSSGRIAAGAEWEELEDAIFYRWSDAAVRGELSCAPVDGELNRYWEAERKKSNLPALLITSEGHRVTLRFHPLHRTMGGIRDIKSAFSIALHRPEARPDCQIRWLD